MRPSGVHERDHDVAGALGDWQALVVVGQAARVHQSPAPFQVNHTAVVPQEVAATTFIIYVWCIQSNIDCVRRRVVVGAQKILLLWVVSDDKVHDSLRRVVEVPHEDFLLHRPDVFSEEEEPVLL